MKYIISGTNRKGSRTLQIAKLVQALYQENNEVVEIIDLEKLPLHELRGEHYGSTLPEAISEMVHKINEADGLILVVPEYNGSMPGALKYFIDFWIYPESFEFRPVCFVGLGGKFGGLRPVEHLQQVFGYRNAFIYPQRVFLIDIWTHLKDGQLLSDSYKLLLKDQVQGFQKFTQALRSEQLDANYKNKHRTKKV